MWSKSSSFLHTNKIAAANLVGGLRFATAAVNRYNGSTSRSLFGHGYFFRCQEKIPPNSRRTRGQTYGQCFGFDQRGHPSPYSMDHPMNMAPALFAVEEYNKKKNAKLHFVRVVHARQMLFHGDFIQNVYFDAVDGGVTEMYNARVQSRFGCNMKLISFGGGNCSMLWYPVNISLRKFVSLRRMLIECVRSECVCGDDDLGSTKKTNLVRILVYLIRMDGNMLVLICKR
nr:uncharacterized protein LOC103417392 isoform X2 [Malus domestica]XP_008353825.2 uncharacterized protein LOC103417392 isoform X2 [Malus domestica]XP_028955333.1 uncharacterized protein LOC103417392 isoform X2 [Malus domestica]